MPLAEVGEDSCVNRYDSVQKVRLCEMAGSTPFKTPKGRGVIHSDEAISRVESHAGYIQLLSSG
jgi:hypothetical protein